MFGSSTKDAVIAQLAACVSPHNARSSDDPAVAWRHWRSE